MDRNITNEAWLEAWNAFLITIENLLLRKRGLIGEERQVAGLDALIEDQRRAARADALIDLLSDLLHLVRHEMTEEVVFSTLDEASAFGDRTAIMITAAQMMYVARSFPAEQIQDMDAANSGIEAAKYVNESVQWKLNWGRPPKTLLDGLGDLLSIGRSV